MTFLGILLVYIIVFIGVLIRNQIKTYNYIGMNDKSERMITITAEGISIIKPDVAKVTLGVTKEADTVEEAQLENTEIMNSLLVGLKEMEISDSDIQTNNYNVNPVYDYDEEEGRVLDGYQVFQQVIVKVKDTTKTSEVLALAGEMGITNIGNLEWIVDDRDHYTDLARKDALDKVKNQVETLSSSLGVNFVDIISYNEYNSNNYTSYDKVYSSEAYGLGGGSVPSISEGEEEVNLNVNITFEIK